MQLSRRFRYFKTRRVWSSWHVFKIVKTTFLLFCCLLIILIVCHLIFNTKIFYRDLNYYIRPFYGSPAKMGPPNVISHFYSDLVPARNRCQAHGWTPREGKLPRVIDSVIFSVELDILEIRLKELWNVVDIFVIIEASTTFTGNTKRLYFHENKHRYHWASKKIRYFQVTTLSPTPNGTYENEDLMRNISTTLIASVANHGDLIIGSDVDEIPSEKAILLLKNCQGYPRELHLLQDEYLYSFEFPAGTTTWRPHITQFDIATFWYHHEIMPNSTDVLTETGWHCSFCFRYLSEFFFKMTSYSHSENMISGNYKYLELEEIQRRICEGVDVFDLPPEAYSVRDFISRWGPMRKKLGTVNLPASLVQDMDNYRWLLPGGCIREDSKHYG